MRKRYFTSQQAADALGVGVSTLQAWAAKGLVAPAWRTPGGQARWDIADLERQLDMPPSPSDDTLLRAFLEEVAQVPTSRVEMVRLGLQLNPEHRQELLDRLAVLFDEFARRELDPDGARESLFLAIHPEP